jgi:hypothetical protein
MPVVRIHAGSPAQLLTAIGHELGTSRAEGMSVVPAPPNSVTRRFLNVRLPEDPRDATYASWRALVTAVAYRDQATANGLVPVGGEQEEGGTYPARVGGGGALPGGDGARTTYRAMSPASLRCAVRRDAARVGLSVTSLRTPLVEGIPVVMVVARVPSALAHRSGGSFGLSSALFRTSTTSSLGWFVVLEDGSGGWVQSAGLIPAAGRGVDHAAPGYQGAQACGRPQEIECSSHA